MAFKRRETTVEAVDINTVTPHDAEKGIIAGVRKYATNEANWSAADANTPYLGSIIGMGIESSNLADITMSIERQFLTRKTKRVPVDETGSEFLLEDGELGKLRILEGQDALAATPGLSLKMLMDLGHMPGSASYLETVASFATITALGEGYKLNESLKKNLARIEKLAGAERADAVANLRSLEGQARAYDGLIADPAALSASRQKTLQQDQSSCQALRDELSVANEKLNGVTASDDASRVSSLRNEAAEIKTRLKLMEAKLRVSQESAAGAAKRTPVEAALFQRLRWVIAGTLAKSASIL